MFRVNKYELNEINSQMVAWRRQLHQHPETAYTEFETAKLVANILRGAGLEVHEKIAVTGVVGVLKSGTSTKAIALRADMDALNIHELNTFDYKSKVD
jgi:hippurate hydrolase